jgi:hypothetical protein
MPLMPQIGSSVQHSNKVYLKIDHIQQKHRLLMKITSLSTKCIAVTFINYWSMTLQIYMKITTSYELSYN